MNDAVLEIRDLRVEFPELDRSVQAVRGCGFALRSGEILGLIGESGCGKSVTALACLGLVPPPGVVNGSIIVDGEQVIGASRKALADLRGGKIAMIFQNPGKALNPFITVGRQMTDVIRVHRPVDGNGARDLAIEALELVRLADPRVVLGKYPHQLSGGQLQRVMVAMAVSCDPLVLIADEPTTALDVTIQGQIIVLIRDLARSRGLTVLFITHDQGVVASLCDRVAVMYAGRIVEMGSADDLYRRPHHPYTRKLMHTAPRLGRGKADLDVIPGQVPDMRAPPQGCAFHPRCPHALDLCRRVSPQTETLDRGHTVSCHRAKENV